MNNFEFCISTKAIFGKGQIERLLEVVEAYGKKYFLLMAVAALKKLEYMTPSKRFYQSVR